MAGLLCTKADPPDFDSFLQRDFDPTEITAQLLIEANAAFAEIADVVSSLGDLQYNFTVGDIPAITAYSAPDVPVVREVTFTDPVEPSAVSLDGSVLPYVPPDVPSLLEDINLAEPAPPTPYDLTAPTFNNPAAPDFASLDFTDPTAPTAVQVTAPSDFVAPTLPDFATIDVTDPTAPTPVTLEIPTFAAPEAPGFASIEFTDPTAPTAVAIPEPSAFVAPTLPTFSSVDVTEPVAPTIITLEAPTFAAPAAPDFAGIDFTDPTAPTAVQIAEPSAFVSPTLPVFDSFDVTDPVAPTLVTIDVPTFSSPAVPDFASLDFTDPTAPTPVQVAAPSPFVNPTLPDFASLDVTEPVAPITVTLDAPTFNSPLAPDFASLDFVEPTAPTAVQIAEPSPFVMPVMPAFNETVDLDLSGGPGAAPAYTLSDAPAVSLPEMPAAPAYSVPAVPVISGLDIPDIVELEPITVSVDFPDSDLPDISDSLDYTNALWASANLDDMASHMARIRGGDFAIGEDIFRQIFNRAMVQVRRESVAQERQGRRAWGRLGWDIPGGVAFAAERDAAESISRANSFHAMDTAVKEATQKNEDFWKSIELGAQLEGLYLEAHKAYHDRALRYAVAVVDASVAILNAYVARYNAQVAAARLTIEEARVRLESQRIQLEQDRLRIEAAIARGEAQKLELALYQAQWEGINAAVRVYATQIEAVKTNVDAQRAVLEAHNLNIQGYATRVDAWAKEWEGQRVKLQGEELRVQRFDSYVRAHASDIQGFSAEVQGESARVSSGAEIMRAKIENAKLAQEQYRTEWQGVQTKIDALAKSIDADTKVFEAQSRNEQARVSSLTEIEKTRQQAATVDVERYRAEWQGQQTRVDALARTIEADTRIYEAQGRNEQVRINAGVEIMRATVENAKLALDQYRIEWEGVQTKIDALTKAIDADVRIYEAQSRNEQARVSALTDVERVRQQAAAVDIDRYKAEWQGQQTRVDALSKTIDADTRIYEAQGRNEQVRISSGAEIMRAKVENAKLALDQYRTEWQGVQTRVDALAKSIEADTRVYEAQSRNEQARISALTDIERVRQQASAVDVDRYKAEWQGQQTRVDALTKTIDADVRLYEAQGRNEQVRISSGADIMRAKVENAKLALDQYRTEWQGIQTKVDAAAKTLDADTRLYEAQSRNEQARITALTEIERVRQQSAAVDVDRYKAEWQGQQTRVDALTKIIDADTRIYEAQGRNEQVRITAGADVMRAKIENARLALDQYRAEWQGIQTKVDALAKAIDADTRVYESLSRNEQTRVTSLTEIEKLRAQASAIDVDRYKAEWEGVTAMVTARTNINESRVKLFEGQVRGAVASVEGSARALEAETKIASLETERYTGHWQGIAAKAGAFSAMASADAQIYSAQVQGAQTQSQVGIENSRLQLQWQDANQRGEIEAARLAVQQVTDTARLAETAQIALGQIYAQLLAATWSSASYSESVSKGLSYSISDKNSYTCNMTSDAVV